MSALTIDLKELEEGDTRFEWDASAEDLDLLAAGVTFAEPSRVEATIHKLGDALSADGTCRFTARFDCARCSEPIALSYNFELQFVFQKGKPRGIEGDEDETLVWLDVDSDVIDLGQELRDYVLLEIPMNPVCWEYESGTCPNLKELEQSSSKASDRDVGDPRWDALRALKE